MSPASVWSAFQKAVHRAAGSAEPAAVLAGITEAAARSLDVEPPPVGSLFGEHAVPAVSALDVPPSLAGPDLPGRILESLLEPGARHRAGAYYTRTDVAEGLVAAALDGWTGAETGRDGEASDRARPPAPASPGGSGSEAPTIPPDLSTPRNVASSADDGRRGYWVAGRRPGPSGPAVCDPAVGGGAFLLAAARALRSTGLAPADVVTGHLWGIDIDPLAVATTRAVLALWAATEGCPLLLADDRLVVGDFLAERLPAWSLPHQGFDAVVGNPPFQGQLDSSTVRSADAAAAMRAWLGDAVHGYVDTAALFLVASCRRAAPGGRIALVLPESVLASAHAAGARRSVLDVAGLRGLWIPGGPMFGAAVRVCSPVLEIGAAPTPTVRRWSGPKVQLDGELTVVGPGPSRAPPSTGRAEVSPLPFEPGEVLAVPDGTGGAWTRLMAAASGVPATDLGGGRDTLASVATATAGFRQHFYGLAGYVRERDREGLAPLVTVGAIDPARCRWGEGELRFAGRRWQRPAVDLEALGRSDAAADVEIARWLTARLVPKVLVATQTSVVEAVVDAEGAWVPSVPVIAVEPFAPTFVWHVAAVLLAPPVSVWAAERAWGSGLGKGTLRLSARLVVQVPLPPDVEAWDQGAKLVRVAHETGDRADLLEAGRVMTAAYGLEPDHPALAWWAARVPERR